MVNVSDSSLVALVRVQSQGLHSRRKLHFLDSIRDGAQSSRSDEGVKVRRSGECVCASQRSSARIARLALGARYHVRPRASKSVLTRTHLHSSNLPPMCLSTFSVNAHCKTLDSPHVRRRISDIAKSGSAIVRHGYANVHSADHKVA